MLVNINHKMYFFSLCHHINPQQKIPVRNVVLIWNELREVLCLLEVRLIVFVVISLDQCTEMIDQLEVPRVALSDFLQIRRN